MESYALLKSSNRISAFAEIKPALARIAPDVVRYSTQHPFLSFQMLHIGLGFLCSA